MKALLCLTVLSLMTYANNAMAEEDYCERYPDSPVCVVPTDSSQSFCQANPSNPACGGSSSGASTSGATTSTASETTAGDSGSPDTSATNSGTTVSTSDNQVVPPVQPNEPLSNQRTNIVLVTDQPGAAAAIAIRDSLARTAPFSCMNLKVEIRQVTREELGCNPRMSRPRLLECDSRSRRLANDIRRNINDDVQVDTSDTRPRRRNLLQRIFGGGHRRNSAQDAESAIVVVDYDQWAGAGYERTPLVSSRLHPRGAIHELLHGIGYHDEYQEGVYRPGGTIMNTIEGSIPTSWWPTIAEYFHTTTPTSCNNQ